LGRNRRFGLISHATMTSALITSSCLRIVEVFTCLAFSGVFLFLFSPFRGRIHSGMALALMDGIEESSLTKGLWIWIVTFSFRIHISAELRAWKGLLGSGHDKGDLM
jgi:hypothetical protein